MNNAKHGNSANPTSAIFVKAFLGLILRDLRVLTREFLPFLLRVGMQPLLFLFVFTFILPRMSSGNPLASGSGVDFGTIILPGLMAVAIMFSGIAAVALPLSSEFGITREIDDRVMCPLPLWAVALEKVCFSAMQSIIAALLVIPMAYYVPAAPSRQRGQLVFARAGAGARQFARRLTGTGDRFHGQSQTNRPGLLHHRGAHHLFRLRLLSVGRSRKDPLAPDRRALQPHRLYERRPARRRHTLR